MLKVRSITDLAERIELPAHQIGYLANNFDRFVRHYELVDPSKPDKPPRPIISTIGPLRELQDRLLRKLFLPSIRPSPYNHGGVVRRNTTTNALAHAHSIFGWKTDLAKFFPSIHQSRVHELFATKLGCDERIAGILTRLCTYDHHLAMGLPTSPLLADQVAKAIDARIAGMAKATGLVYTRFVDDITLSGRFSLDEVKCRLPRLVQKIIVECGFGTSKAKTKSGRLEGDEFTITTLRFHNGRLDVASDYIQEIERQIADHRRLASGQEFTGPLMMRDMLRSRIMYVSSIRPTRRTPLLRKFGSIDWAKVMEHAKEQKLIVVRKHLRALDDIDCRTSLELQIQ
jgi:RNA-directed DNA polymerase